MTSSIQPGLLILHGNHTELLAEAVFEWTRAQPLGPLEEEIFLVQNNGMAEWLKMALAMHHGICAAARFDLPARFLWRAYRQAFGREAVPAQSALDKTPLTWRLMEMLPGLLHRSEFAPLADFLRTGDVERRLQLCERLADLYDQYQVFRGDWLDAWAAGRFILPRPGAPAQPLPADQRWQAALWCEVLAPLSDRERAATRQRVHERFVGMLDAGGESAGPLPRRVVLFGTSHLPLQTLTALAALSARSQVLLAVPNPCRYHWADTIEGRELLQAKRRRQPLRQGPDLATVSLEDMHAHAHPLLAAWGRQGRDFVRQLDVFDDVLIARERFALPRIDLFDEGEGQTLLQQTQARIRDLVPLAEHRRAEADPRDRSIVFHTAHSPQREVEILHDQLLDLLAGPAGDPPLTPRDVVVMVPAIETFAPAIQAVFGQYPPKDARHIPFSIADLEERDNNPLVMAIEWLMRLPQQRCRLSEVRGLLDVPAIAARFGLQSNELTRLAAWMDTAGIRWGLSAEQRADLGFEACGDRNTWLFGLRRMLLGYASGVSPMDRASHSLAFEEIEPCGDVGGLEASIAGSLAFLLDSLVCWWKEASTPATPAQWAQRCRQLVEDFVAPTDQRERLTVLALQESLRRWLEACDTAAFEESVPLAVAREAWLSGLEEPDLGRGFRAGGVTFCSLVPMRSIPFEVLCLLGMNDGDYPRRTSHSDFDLMAQPGQMRPGDRSRRHDDRQLMLEALLSTRRVLYVSWTGRNARDNSEQPPSVLVSQLRDYLAAGWTGDVLGARTTEHPLQPFSRVYFETPGATAARPLITHAKEWRAAHAPARTASALRVPAFQPDPNVPVTIAQLSSFLKNPVKQFFRQRLGVVFPETDRNNVDDEAFVLDGLDDYGLLDDVLTSLGRAPDGMLTPLDEIFALVTERVQRIERTGRLPHATFGRRKAAELIETLVPMLQGWHSAHADYPDTSAKEPLRFAHGDLVVSDWLDGLRTCEGKRAWLELMARKLCIEVRRRPEVSRDKLLTAWVRTVVSSACGVAVHGVIVGRDAILTVEPLPQDEATRVLQTLLETWRAGMDEPLPLPCRTALARLSGAGNIAAVYEGRYGGYAEVREPCLARVYPTYEALTACGRFEELSERLFVPLHVWVGEHVHPVLHGQAAGDAIAATDQAGQTLEVV